MKTAAILLAVMFYIQCSPILTPPTIPKSVAVSTPGPCQNDEDFDLAVHEPTSGYVICKNFFLQPKTPLVLNVSPDIVENLTFINSVLPIIPAGAFSSYPKLVQLHLNHNDVKVLIPGAFNGLSKLEGLYLQTNAMMDISNGTLNSLTSLKTLDLSRNALMTIERGSFTELHNLRVLNLTRNSLFYLENDSFTSLANLESLDLSYNYLSGNDPIFELNLQTKHLKLLLINNNLLVYLPLVLTETLNLEVLDVSSNALTEINFGLVPQSKFSNFSNNQIVAVTGWSYLDNAVAIDFSKNNLGPRNIIGEVVQKLYLRSSGLEFLNGFDFIMLSNITEIDLGYNIIAYIDVLTFRDLIYLEKLHLNNNKISDLPIGCFDGLRSLTLLSLSHNSLKRLKGGIFNGLPELTDLYLDHNQLTVIHEQSFSVLTSLQRLYLNNNSLKMVNIPLLVAYLPSLVTARFEHNDWDCQEIIKWTTALQKDFVDPYSSSFFYSYEVACNDLQLKVVPTVLHYRKFSNTFYIAFGVTTLFILTILDVSFTIWLLSKLKLLIDIKDGRLARCRLIFTKSGKNIVRKHG